MSDARRQVDVSDNPYESPAIAELGPLPLGDSADPGSAKLGMLVWTVLILDAAGCSIRLLLGVGFALFILGHAFDFSVLEFLHRDPFSFTLWLVNQFGIGLCGLSGSVLVLAKKRAGFPLAAVSIGLVLLIDGYGMRRLGTDPVAALLLVQIGWTVVYGIVVWIAARRMGGTIGRRPEV